MQPRNNTVVGAYFGHGWPVHPSGLRKVRWLVDRTAVGEDERGKLARGGEGGEDFDVARGGRRTTLLAPLWGRGGIVIFPVIFAISAIARLPSTRVEELRADAVVDAGVHPEDSARVLRNSSEQPVLKAE